MTKKLNCLSNLAILLGALFMFSCSPDDDNVTPDPGNTKECLITEENYYSNNSYYQTIFEYDAQKKISRIKNFKDSLLTGDSILFEYNSDGLISKQSLFSSRSDLVFDLFFYNSGGQLIKWERTSKDNSGNPVTVITTIEYDSNGKKIKEKAFYASAPSKLEGYLNYTYINQNTVKIQHFEDHNGDNIWELMSEYEGTYDSKKNAKHSIGILQNVINSPNNVIKEVTNLVGDPSSPYIFNYSYDYNPEGYPTKTTRSSGTSVIYVMNSLYNCN